MATSSLSQWIYSFFKSDYKDSFSGFTQEDLLNDIKNMDTFNTEQKYSLEIDSTYQDCVTPKSNMADDSSSVPNFLKIQHNIQSITITADSKIIPTIKKFLEGNLYFQQGHSNNELIYKSMDTVFATVTLYITTGKIHIHGPGYTDWQMGESTSLKLITSHPRASTPIPEAHRSQNPVNSNTALHEIIQIAIQETPGPQFMIGATNSFESHEIQNQFCTKQKCSVMIGNLQAQVEMLKQELSALKSKSLQCSNG
ncbi:hypothetical protein CHS0354_025265 [Potamilus streckersoni]|uniref:Uncharacterized protein n=1 Tax=Potamilus streckersoni TaxID=2493646 RepID=A0AAE0RS87_9BIVA|nr:hypothetical protein CHS0354_025265 [Potamilus streckersoni]